jgi:spermidine synthase
MQPWQVIERFETREGPLELRRRGERDFLITISGRVLMTSVAHRSEDRLAELACEAVAARPRPRVLIGGLGMGYTLRAALDRLPPDAEVTMVELNARVVAWCEGPLAPLTKGAVRDRRVRVQVADVARVVGASPPGRFDAIVIDLYEGPHQATNRMTDPLYGAAAIERTWAALRMGGVWAVWSEEPDLAFESRLGAAGFAVRKERGGRGGRAHVVYLAEKRERRFVGEGRPPRERSSERASDDSRRPRPGRGGRSGRRS